MSYMSGFGQKTFKPVPPEKGSFPLDHEGQTVNFYININFSIPACDCDDLISIIDHAHRKHLSIIQYNIKLWRMLEYLLCLHQSDGDNSMCRLIAKEYLQCRMDKDLMKKEEWSKLGFNNKNVTSNEK
ncbi:cytochrome c oxidase assembly protein COX19-like [Centruroides vittatus]|uniref:cytochrome c oxidase assembly protein COX19-like n=1 Tax=Centruroides vittatus TaxID=120091 RepID=UPI0035109D5A